MAVELHLHISISSWICCTKTQGMLDPGFMSIHFYLMLKYLQTINNRKDDGLVYLKSKCIGKGGFFFNLFSFVFCHEKRRKGNVIGIFPAAWQGKF